MKLLIILFSSLFLFACTAKDTSKTNEAKFSTDEENIEEIIDYNDKLANEKIEITETKNLNQDFPLTFKTFNPDGTGNAIFKAKSIKEIAEVDGRTAEDGNKLILVEIAVRGNRNNKGIPSTFNQIGEYPSPQFVLIDKENNKSYTETNYFSTSYTATKKLFELDKITLDHEEWVNTALVFEIDKKIITDLAFRFTNSENKTEFYDIKD
jgi:hypothetical protein